MSQNMNDARRRVRVLLINPRFPESFWSYRWALRTVLKGKRALNPPLGLATLAALCPDHWEVEICDENVEALRLAPDADIIGVCGMAVQHPRQRELLRYYKSKGYYVVAGGSFASLCPERFPDLADSVVAGEAEYIWPQFCRDFEQGQPNALYRETGVVQLDDSPTPRFDLLQLEHYTSASLQFSRGCPYRCDFCDIIVMFGRRPRTKSLAQIERELDALRAHGVRQVFFVDDNLIGHKAKAKQLLDFLRDYQHRHGYRFELGTEASVNLAADDELLALFRDSGFAWVFLGIETPDTESLRQAGKTQNVRGDLLAAVRALYRHGIDVLGGFIVGFDNDTTEAFEAQYRFITAAGVQVAMVGLLTALPHTPLYERLEKEGRLLPEADNDDNTKARTNVRPLCMSRTQLLDGYRALYRRLSTDREIARRVRNKMRWFGDPRGGAPYPPFKALAMGWRLLVRGILAGGPRRLRLFAGTLLHARPRLWSLACTEWVRGLAMQDYVRRHLTSEVADAGWSIKRAAGWLRSSCMDAVRRGALIVTPGDAKGAPQMTLTLRGWVEPRALRRLTRRLRKVLKRSGATLTLNVDAVAGVRLRSLRRLFRRLMVYGDRICVRVADPVRSRLGSDWSAFWLALDADSSGPMKKSG